MKIRLVRRSWILGFSRFEVRGRVEEGGGRGVGANLEGLDLDLFVGLIEVFEDDYAGYGKVILMVLDFR